METPHIIERPQRWAVSFDPDMKESDVDRLLCHAPFSKMDATKFPRTIPLRGILRQDTRLHRFRHGEIVVREGDHGTSAFLVVSGKARVVLAPGLPASMLGRRVRHPKGLWGVLTQLWTNAKEAEVRRVMEPTGYRQGESQSEHSRETRIFLQDLPRILEGHRTATLESGEFFGELAALSRMPRTATVVAESLFTELLEIRWQGLRDLMRYDKTWREHIDRTYRDRALETFLRAMPLFRHLSDAQLQTVIAQTEFATYGEYDWSGSYKRLAKAGTIQPVQEPLIATEGDYPNGVTFIRAGFARLSQRFGHSHRTLNYLGCGYPYGLEEIAHNWRRKTQTVPLQYTLRALGYTHVLFISTAVMEEIVLPTLPENELPQLITPRETNMPIERRASSTAVEAHIGHDQMEFFAEHRFYNGTAAMVINLDLCTRCDECVRACAVAHDNNPRFLRHGPISGNLMVANACMHCADPVCMIGCPTGAIHRDPLGGQVVINQTTCIGCNLCANNCPYDAIRMVEIRNEAGAFMVDKELKPILKATKCDLCVEQYGGPACQRACPHGALIRADLTRLTDFQDWLER